jgi:hypothetical protein
MTVDKNGNLGGQQPPWEPEVTPEVTEADIGPVDDGALGSPWNRRTFLKAAALGTAAAALWQKGPGWKNWGPAAAYANDLSNKPCTAEDVEIIGTGIVLNEPCTCSGTFSANVQFTVRNSSSAARYCIALHLVPTTVGGVTIPGQDVILHRADGLSQADGKANGTSFRDTVMTGTILNFPCNSAGSQVCFGSPGVTEGKCDPGTCTTIAWNTSNNAINSGEPDAAHCATADQNPPGGQCRHQQVCVQGFGIAVACADASCATRALTNNCCAVNCGESLRVKVTANGQSGTPCATPLTISVKRPGASSFTNVTLNAAGCYVDSSPVQGTYTFRATDCHGCFREATLAVCVASITAPVISVGNPDCSGNVTVTITSGCPQTGVTYTLQTASACDGTFTDTSAVFTNCATTIQLTQGATTALRVKASNGTAACDQTSNCVTKTVPAALSIAAPVLSNNPCSGVVTFNPGTVTGGVGPFSYEFKLGSGSFVSGSSFTYNPALVSGALDTGCKSLVVRVTDANGCTATSPATTFSQCISTTTGCTP